MAPTPTLQQLIEMVEAETPDPLPLGRLSAASVLAAELADVGDAALGYFVDQARRAGHSWSEIGDALGVSKQAAQQRHVGRQWAGRVPTAFDRFTPRARNVITAAEEIARRWRATEVGPEHLFLGLYREPAGVAAQILEAANLPAEAAERSLAEGMALGPGSPKGPLPLAPATTVALSGAGGAALELGHSYLGTEHLLLGLAGTNDAVDRVLRDAQLTKPKILHRVKQRLKGLAGPARTARRPSPPATRRPPRAGAEGTGSNAGPGNGAPRGRQRR